MKSFSELFKKYRLRAEFETFASFSDALAGKGFFYEESIFSHWQKGTRIPTNRILVLKMLEIFAEKRVLTTLQDANEFLASAKMGYLTKEEVEKLHLRESNAPFQVPSQMVHFIGRTSLLKEIEQEIDSGKNILLYGPPGVGKTAIAIKIGYLLREKFSDGVLWYKVDSSNVMDILLSIAALFGEDISAIKSVSVRSSTVRTLLRDKKVLLIFDNVSSKDDLSELIPNNPTSSVIMTSQENFSLSTTHYTQLKVNPFTTDELLELFQTIFDKNYVKRYKNAILNVGNKFGNLPLASHISAHIILNDSKKNRTTNSIDKYIKQLDADLINLQVLHYEDKNLYKAINVSYKNLSKETQAVFLSLAAFEGKDFSVEAISYMNGISLEKAKVVLDELHSTSFIELSFNNKYRIHPIIKKFINEKLNYPHLSAIIKFVLLFFGSFTIFWIVLNISKPSLEFDNIFGNSYFIIPLWGSFWGFIFAKRWGGIKSIVGKTLFFFSLGLFFQTLGQIIYSFYVTLLNITIPYPSLGDIGYFGSVLIYLYAVLLLAKVNRIKINLTFFTRHIFVMLLFLSFLIAGYAIILQHYIFYWSNPFKILLDFSYPFGDLYFSFLIFLLYLELKRAKKSVMENVVFLFFTALFMQYLSDYVFIYQANLGTWQGAHINDYMYLTAYVLMSLAIFRLSSSTHAVVKD